MNTYQAQVSGAVSAPVTPRVNVKALRQSILDELDTLPSSKWSRGINLTGNGSGEAPVVISRQDRFVTISHRGKQLSRIRMSPDKHNKLQPDSRNREAVEKALSQIVQTNPEVASIMANQA
jgi:hypothetical protein